MSRIDGWVSLLGVMSRHGVGVCTADRIVSTAKAEGLECSAPPPLDVLILLRGDALGAMAKPIGQRAADEIVRLRARVLTLETEARIAERRNSMNAWLGDNSNRGLNAG